MTEFYMFPVEDNDFQPDTLEKCFLLFRRLGELAADIIWENEEYEGKNVWVVWEAQNG